MRLRSFIMRTALAATAVALLLPSVALAQPPQQTFTGHQVFEGAFFGVGPLADARPALRSLAVHVTGNRAGAPALRALENAVQRVDPSYFREIGSQMTSGDPGAVQAAVTRTVGDLERSMNAASRSQHARNLAFANPVTYPETVTVLTLLLYQAIEYISLTESIVIVFAAPPGQSHYRSEQIIAVLTTELANVAISS